MALTYTAISTVTVGSGGASTIDFSSIPNTYTDLAVLYSTRVTASANSIIGYFRFNGNSANYTWRRVRSDGSSAASAANTATTEIYGFYSSAANDTANTFSNNLLYIPNYTSSNNKSVSCDTASENNGTEAYAGFIAGLWSNSAAITQITFYPNSGDFAQYSTATLYGIKNTV